jgi:hypothetical protein
MAFFRKKYSSIRSKKLRREDKKQEYNKFFEKRKKLSSTPQKSRSSRKNK